MRERIYSEIIAGIVTICQLVKKYFISAFRENSRLCSFKPYFFFVCLRQGFSVALQPVLELTVDQADLELTETCLPLPLPPECWD